MMTGASHGIIMMMTQAIMIQMMIMTGASHGIIMIMIQMIVTGVSHGITTMMIGGMIHHGIIPGIQAIMATTIIQTMMTMIIVHSGAKEQ